MVTYVCVELVDLSLVEHGVGVGKQVLQTSPHLTGGHFNYLFIVR